MMLNIDTHIGARLRRRRRLLGLTQQQLAQTCGIGFQQVQKYECGQNRLSAARLWSLARALSIPIGYFYEGLPEAQEPLSLNAGRAIDQVREAIRAAPSRMPSDPGD